MPKGATPLDFAYRIHSAVGNSCVGAKINGKIVPLDTPLETGDRVEVLTSAAAKGPSMDWLKVCKTPQAKAKIRQFFKKELRGENVENGRDMWEKECKRRGVQLPGLLKPEYYDGMLKKYGFTELDDIFGAVGYGGMASAYVVTRLMDEQRMHEAAARPRWRSCPRWSSTAPPRRASRPTASSWRARRTWIFPSALPSAAALCQGTILWATSPAAAA
jgi:GTP pyrophosphokinase